MGTKPSGGDKMPEVLTGDHTGGAKTDVTVVADEGMVSAMQEARGVCPWSERTDVDDESGIAVCRRVVDDYPEMILAVDFTTAQECVAEVHRDRGSGGHWCGVRGPCAAGAG